MPQIGTSVTSVARIGAEVRRFKVHGQECGIAESHEPIILIPSINQIVQSSTVGPLITWLSRLVSRATTPGTTIRDLLPPGAAGEVLD